MSNTSRSRARTDSGAQDDGSQGTVVVGTGDSLNMRSAPGMSGQVVAALPDGERVSILGAQGSWSQVRAGRGEGWVFSKYVARRAVAVEEPAGGQRDAGQRDAGTAAEAQESSAREQPQQRRGLLSRIFGRRREEKNSGDGAPEVPEENGGRQERAPANTPRELRRLLSRSDLSAAQVQQARAMIEQLPPEEQPAAWQALQAATPYISQHNNDEQGPRHTSNGEIVDLGPITCNLTALAMCLQTLGVPNPDPSTTYPLALEHMRQQHFPRMDRKSYDTWARLAQRLGANVVHLQQGDKRLSRQFWMGSPKSALQAGQGVLVSIIGHIVRIQEFTEQGIVVDDPAGASKLLPGLSSNNYKWGSTGGSDHLWPWADVEAHGFRYVGKVVK